MTKKKYLAAANSQLPKGWELGETQRMSKRGVTFTLVLHAELQLRVTEIAASWAVHIDQPRCVLRAVVEDVEGRGIAALLDPKHGTYTSRVSPGQSGGEELVGLAELLRYSVAA